MLPSEIRDRVLSMRILIESTTSLFIFDFLVRTIVCRVEENPGSFKENQLWSHGCNFLWKLVFIVPHPTAAFKLIAQIGALNAGLANPQLKSFEKWRASPYKYRFELLW